VKEINLNVLGPFSLFKKDEFDYFFNSPVIKETGIYLWAFPYKDSELIYYIGETGRNFEIRMVEHIQNYLSGEYGINEPEEMKKGHRERIWEGLWRGAKFEVFISRYKELVPKILELLSLLRIYLIPIDCKTNLRKRIEGEISKHLFDQGGIVGNFQEPDYRYQLREISNGPLKIKLNFEPNILGLPEELTIGNGE